MNTESVYKAIVSGGNGPRIAGRAILGVILVGTLLLTAAIIYSRAATQPEAAKISAVGASLASNPELMLARRSVTEVDQTIGQISAGLDPEVIMARRYAAAQNQVSGQASLMTNPELALARRGAAMKPAEAALLAANPELLIARRSVASQNLAAVPANVSTNPEVILARRFAKEMERNSGWDYLAANPELSLARRFGTVQADQ